MTKKAHQYRPADIIAKLTDDNVLIPAGTTYSAKDLQTWYNENAEGKLSPEDWKNPEGSGDASFIELFKRWTEGAHTTIGDVPPVPMAVTARQAQLLASHRSALVMFADFEALVTDKIEATVSRRAADFRPLNDSLHNLNERCRKQVRDRISKAEDVVYESNFKTYYKARAAIGKALRTWLTELNNHLESDPPVKQSQRAFIQKIFSDAQAHLKEYDTSRWDKLANPDSQK